MTAAPNPALDRVWCFEALRARDARFDGLFYTAVKTTGVFCRPVCPARTPLPGNVVFYPSAATAQAAGYRPCLRCRPEVAPDLPAAAGTSATVNRALRLIHEGALDAGATAQLAARLGISDRHLRRLFIEHLGVPPVAVAATRRLLFAKKLITETQLPLASIAPAAGYQSVRRFNEAFRATYQRNPGELRRRGDSAPAARADAGLELKLHYRPPYDWAALLRFIGQRGAGTGTTDGGVYQRAGLSVRHDSAANCLIVRLAPEGLAGLRTTVERIRFVFDLRANPGEITAHLRKSPVLRRAIRPAGGMRLPVAWDPFDMAVWVIGGRTAAGYSAAQLANADLGKAGLAPARATALRRLARAVRDGTLRLDGSAASEAVIGQLAALPGVGISTAHYIAMRALGEPDALPSADRALQRAAGVHSARQLENLAEAWRPWRSYAALYLWNHKG